MKRKFIIAAGIFFMFGVAFLLLGLYLLPPETEDISENIIYYSKNHSSMTLKDVTGFEWDEAYVDHQAYGTGEKILEKYNLTNSLSSLWSEEYYRIVFFMDGKYVADEALSLFEIDIKKDMEVIKPDTVFYVEKDPELEDRILLSTEAG